VSALVFSALVLEPVVEGLSSGPAMARGRYRILLGAAAGVGKTYRMLQEGRQAKAEGSDVVIGYLEPHDRPETAALAEGLETVPRLRTAYGRLELEEMDVDSVIRRKPELALIDELAVDPTQVVNG
jgi:two-component system, OmpR family, sensor histidine kinase KdpD